MEYKGNLNLLFSATVYRIPYSCTGTGREVQVQKYGRVAGGADRLAN